MFNYNLWEIDYKLSIGAKFAKIDDLEWLW